MSEYSYRSHRRLRLIALIVLAFVLTACAPLEVAVQPNVYELPLVVAPGQSVGQTFVSTYDGLQGVKLTYSADHASTMECALRSSPDAPSDLRLVTLSLNPASESTSVDITFDPVRDSNNGYYYIVCTVPVTASPVSFKIGTAFTYQYGSIYHDHEPGEAQLTFQLLYDRSLAVWTIASALMDAFGLFSLSLLAYVIPGWALLVYLWPDTRRSLPVFIGLSVGLSVALYPVLFMATHMLGVHLAWLNTWLPVFAATVALLIHYKVWLRVSWRRMWHGITDWFHSSDVLVDVTWLAVVALIFAVRFIVVRNMDAPMWGDSYQHTIITQLMIDNGGLFNSWEPYAPLTSFTYHFGFHANMAVLHWLTGLDAIQSVLWGGQLLNGLAVVTLTPLAARMSKRRWTEVFTIVVAGALTAMPMSYTNWGRYTQLAGLVILPVAMLLSLDLLNARKRQPNSVLLAWLTVGGLALTHLRVLIFYVLFVIVWFLIDLKNRSILTLIHTIKNRLSRIAWLAVGGMLIFLPWLAHGYGGAIQRNFATQIKAPAQFDNFAKTYNSIGPLDTFMAPVLWVLMFAGMMLALWHKDKLLRLLIVWAFAVLLATNPGWLWLPGTGVISNFALYISIYIPAAWLIAYLVDHLLASSYRNQWLRIVVVLMTGLVALFGANLRRSDINSEVHALVTPNDMKAAAWIQDNVPETANFWTNGFLAYFDNLVVGSDAGWWLTLIAKRDTVIPPLTYGTETASMPDLKPRLKQLVLAQQQYGPEDAEFVAQLQSFDVTHVYIGQLQGQVNYSGPGILDPHVLVDSPFYTLVYHEDRVWIFELNYAAMQ